MFLGPPFYQISIILASNSAIAGFRGFSNTRPSVNTVKILTRAILEYTGEHTSKRPCNSPTMSGFINLILRVVAFVFTIIITGLIGNVIAKDDHASTSARAAVNFTMFVAALSWVVCIYGMLATVISSLGKPIILTALDGLGVLFTFLSAIVLAGLIGNPNCSNTYDRKHNWIGYGSFNTQNRCRELQASDAFMWFLWAILCGGLFFSLTEMRSPMGASRSARPAMSQV
ncbi:hypothetical protein NLG97_g3581 [Lecanicillium saksenae]|uniref:Uncharacterized protein n=1 Tax=Lecanicillium saksenae TaxID=468837 RepID=A0ACC1QZ43_9HYPO|nr:hypothetical protein NLG97_g3581 [Lecanicillium saksenae]